MKTVVVIIDSLRFDETPRVPGLNLYRCKALANNPPLH